MADFNWTDGQQGSFEETGNQGSSTPPDSWVQVAEVTTGSGDAGSGGDQGGQGEPPSGGQTGGTVEVPAPTDGQVISVEADMGDTLEIAGLTQDALDKGLVKLVQSSDDPTDLLIYFYDEAGNETGQIVLENYLVLATSEQPPQIALGDGFITAEDFATLVANYDPEAVATAAGGNTGATGPNSAGGGAGYNPSDPGGIDDLGLGGDDDEGGDNDPLLGGGVSLFSNRAPVDTVPSPALTDTYEAVTLTDTLDEGAITHVITGTLDGGAGVGLVDWGTDGKGGFTLLADTSGLPTLSSHDVQVEYNVSGDTLTATIEDNGQTITVFTFQLTYAGTYTLTLYQPLDHADGDGVNSLSIDLSSIIQAQDYDDDFFTLQDGQFVINVLDDVPSINVNAAVSSTVDEGGLPDGNDPGAAITATGSLAGLVDYGADR